MGPTPSSPLLNLTSLSSNSTLKHWSGLEDYNHRKPTLCRKPPQPPEITIATYILLRQRPFTIIFQPILHPLVSHRWRKNNFMVVVAAYESGKQENGVQFGDSLKRVKYGSGIFAIFMVVMEWKTSRYKNPQRFPLVNVTPSASKRVKRKWQNRRERKVDKEYDVVLVPSDGGCLSGSESDDSDWSIGWLEPHGAGFYSDDDDDDDDSDDSFAVLVPCYGRGCGDVVNTKNVSNDRFLDHTIGQVPDIYSTQNEVYMEQWLSSLQRN
ncbi:unnamed protein product [Lactuca saligna]|uniref:Uncharacterized protein n=1 Tax=Lactuca saligna TaxID=75948 RepID=A0AA36A1Y3_LACSI|nr:unnamed protein product [Lactuca saligna]